MLPSIVKASLNEVASRDRFRLHKLAAKLEKNPEPLALTQLIEQIEKSCQWVVDRQASKPTDIDFDSRLPINSELELISSTIADNQVTIIAGSTGSGKTTQLPKMCLQLGLGVRGLIGHTQPRRIAARTVATRISEELGSPLGHHVGYQVRFTDQVSEHTHIKLMTDGILLAELQNDRFLSRYDTLIIDEAHERSLNIDFLLGYLKTLLPKRPDLKVIITSATIDVERFSKHFFNAPVIEVSGRTFPVDIQYLPVLENNQAETITDAVLLAIENILELPLNREAPDILVFLSGERDIRELAGALRQAQFSHCTILPLYARLSVSEQAKVFAPHKGRRIVLATNVAETSLTVPGIGYVIDPGTARMSRYSVRSKIQRLPIEAISQASANQRAGRCGRISPGVCIRLYSEEDFCSRPEFTDPEILRTNLAAVILQMAQLRLESVEKFPFIDQPDSRLVRDGYQLLNELQAFDSRNKLTANGRIMAILPVDPRLGNIVIKAQQQNCLTEILIIVSVLAVQDPRDRPSDKQQAADEKHRSFWDKDSDFLSYVNMWLEIEKNRQELSGNQFQKWCKRNFLSYLRVREWREIHTQLMVAIKPFKYKLNHTPASYQSVHTALLSGFLALIAEKAEDNRYLGTRNRVVQIFPGSSQFKPRPPFIVSASILETSQVFAHTVAKVDRAWVVEQALHLVKRQTFEPYYHGASGQVKGFEKVTLYGLTLIEKSPVNFSKKDPEAAREIFIRQALVEGQYNQAKKIRTQLANKKPDQHFFLHQSELIKELELLEAKTRRRDIIADDQLLYDFYNRQLPSHITHLDEFESWRKKAEQAKPKLLFISRSDIVLRDTNDIAKAQFPNQLKLGDIVFQLSYHFEPNHAADGVSIHVPVTALHLISANRLQWLIPGLLHEKCVALIKQLPKQWRKQLVPVPDVVDKALARLSVSDTPLVLSLGDYIKKDMSVALPDELWAESSLDDYYRFNIKVVDDQLKEIDQGRDLAVLKERYKDTLQRQLSEAGNDFEKADLSQWSFDSLPATYELKRQQMTVTTYPAIVDNGSTVDLVLFDNPDQAKVDTLKGLVRLAILHLKPLVSELHKNLMRGRDLGLSMVNMGNRQAVIDDIISGAIRHQCFDELLQIDQLPRTQREFLSAIDQKSQSISAQAHHLADALVAQLTQVTAIKKAIKQAKNPLIIASAASDITNQLAGLYWPGYVYLTPTKWLDEYARYLKAIAIRLDKVAQQVHQDRAHSTTLKKLSEVYIQALTQQPTELLFNTKIATYRFMCEELRVSIFAQQLGTALPVSVKRLNKFWNEGG